MKSNTQSLIGFTFTALAPKQNTASPKYRTPSVSTAAYYKAIEFFKGRVTEMAY